MKWLAFFGFLLTVPAANWLIGHVGTVCVPNGPCLVPVAPGLMAPSGVLMIGAALVLRDLVQQMLGVRWALAAIGLGVALSALLAPPALVAASAIAFGLAELADLLVYTPLRNRGRHIAAVAASGLAGAVVDSAVFLWLAFGSLDFIAGQIVGKIWFTIAAAAILFAIRRLRTNEG